MIEVKNLTKHYNAVPAIEDVSFHVNKGEILGFLGPNGAGKTTTMRILTCFMPATYGSAKVAGFDIFEESMEVRKRIGYLPEHPPLYHDMRVIEYLDYIAKIKGGGTRLSIKSVVEQCWIGDVQNKIIGNLSKGYQQRVGLAQALLNSPEVLILDEPTIGLDPKQIIAVRELIKSLANRHTILLSTHILPEVEMTCNRVVIINKGRIVAEDTPQNLTDQLRDNKRIYLETDIDKKTIEKIIKIDGITSIEKQSSKNNHMVFIVESSGEKDLRNDIATTIINNGFSLYEMKSVRISLEDVFLELITKEDNV